MKKGRMPEKDINCVAVAGDGATSDIGIQALSGAFERNHDFLYLCFDNEAYMNTGIQRSSATPYGASTTTAPAGKLSIGQTTWKKNMPEIAVAHNIPYVATACPSYPFDLRMNKVKKGADVKGPAYVHIFSPCPTGWRHASDLAIELGRLAVETGIFPLYEVENGKYKLNVDRPKVRPVEECLKPQGRFRHLLAEDIAKIQEHVNEEYAKLKAKAAKLAAQTAAMAAAFQEAAERHGARVEFKFARSYSTYNWTDSDPIEALAMAEARRLRISPLLEASGGGSDANIYAEAGIPCAVLSTGMEDVHTSQEHIAIADMVNSARLLQEILLAG